MDHIDKAKKKTELKTHTHFMWLHLLYYFVTIYCPSILIDHHVVFVIQFSSKTHKKQSFGCFAHHQLATIDVADDDENQDSWYLLDINLLLLLLLFKLYTVSLCVYVSHDLIKLSTEWTNTQREKKINAKSMMGPPIHSFIHFNW